MNIIEKDKWNKTKFQDVVININKSVKDPLALGINKSIGLENINPNNLKIQSFTDIEKEGTKFSKLFKKDQFLFGSRRAYLRQMALADFDGVCTANIMVFDIKDPNKMTHGYLSMIIQSDLFVDYASRTSVGSLFPSAKWSSLANFNFPLPPLEEQKQIASLFQSIETAMEQVDGQEKNLKELRQKLIDSLCEKDESISKAFNTSEWKKCRVEDVAYWYQRNIPNSKQNEEGINNYITADHIDSNEIFITRNGTISDGKKGPTITKHIREGDFLLSTRSVALCKAAVTKVSGVTGEKLIVIDVLESSKIIKELLPYIMHSTKFWSFAKNTASGSVNKFSSWNKIKLYEFYLPTVNEQKQLLEIFQQIDTVINQIKQQKKTFKNLKQKLLNEILG